MNNKWQVTFTLPNQGAKMFKELICSSDWFSAKALLEAKYFGIIIKNYTKVN